MNWTLIFRNCIRVIRDIRVQNKIVCVLRALCGK